MKQTKKEKLEAIKQQMLVLIQSLDTESAHGEADDLLCQALELLGQKELTEIYDKIDKWYA